MPKHIEGIEVVNKNLERATQEMLANVVVAVEVTVNEAVLHAKQNHGPGAHGQGRFETQTANLVQSIHANQTRVIPGQLVEGSMSAGMEYAEAVEKGTAPHRIEAVNKKALWWPGASHPVKSVQHPGSAAYPFMVPALMAVAQKFKQRVKEALTFKDKK